MSTGEPNAEVDALIERYVREAQAESAASEVVLQAEQIRLRAAFEAGAPLLTLVPVELWDPLEQRAVRIAGGTVLRVAEHEGDIMLGTLTDNTHSLGVAYEEAHRWSARKYFLPLATLCDNARIRTDAVAAERARDVLAPAEVRGLGTAGVDAETRQAVAQLEALAERDDRAVLPRGTRIHLPKGGAARDPQTGETVELPGGTFCEVTEAVGDFRDPNDPVSPPIPVKVGERALTLTFDLLMSLDMKTDVLSPRAQELAAQADLERRRSLQRILGYGLAAGLLTWDAVSYGRKVSREPDPTEANRALVSRLVPQVGALYAYFSAGGKYWFDLQGALLDLKATDGLAAIERLERVLKPVAAASTEAYGVYERQFYRVVHTGWSETRHYRTDKDGKRHYTHSTWSKVYSSVWCEPAGLNGVCHRLSAWRSGDAHREERARRLLDERIFHLLASNAESAEKDFHLSKQSVSFGRDAAISALAAAFTALPPAFYDDFFAWFLGDHKLPIAPHRGRITYQKEVLLTAGAVTGIVLAERHRRKLDAQLRQNKYDLGRQLEEQIRRVPTLDFADAWLEFMDAPRAELLPLDIRGRDALTHEVAQKAYSFRYVHGSGTDNGRALDGIDVDAEPVRHTFQQIVPRWRPLADAVGAVLDDHAFQTSALPVLKNAIGTEILDKQMREDQTEAEGGALKQGLWFAAPLWGAALVDGMLKMLWARRG